MKSNWREIVYMFNAAIPRWRRVMPKSVTVERVRSNLAISSHNREPGDKRVIIERADIPEFIEELQKEVPTQVYILMYQRKMGARPVAIPFSTLQRLKKRVCEIALKDSGIERRFKLAIELHTEHRDFDRAIEVVRVAQQNNTKPLDFDVYWEEEPQVLL
jgi:hypothetical protein